MIIILEPTDDFDAALESAPEGAQIRLEPGRHKTRGNWAHRNWGYGINKVSICAHRDFGPRPVVALENPEMSPGGVFRPAKDVNILWLGAGCSINGVDFDGSLPAFPAYRVGGLRFHGTYTVTNCKVTGLRGSIQDHIEVFIISSQGETSGSKVEKVTAADVKPSSYVSGIFIGATVAPPKGAKQSVVVDCDVQLGAGNWFNYSANYATDFIRCTGSGAASFFHNDTGPTKDVRLSECTGEATENAINLIGVDDTVREIFAEKCILKATRALVLWEHKAGTKMTGAVVLARCTFKSTYAACCIAPSATATFIDCAFPDVPVDIGPECQYKTGTLRPIFFGTHNVKFTAT